MKTFKKTPLYLNSMEKKSFKELQEKWQKKWADAKIFEVREDLELNL